MSTATNKTKSRRNVYIGVFVAAWVAMALGAVYLKAPDVVRDPHAHFQKAQELRAAGNLSAALEEMDAALQIAQDNVGYLTFAGALAVETGRADLAEQHYRRALSLIPANADAVLGLGRVLLERGQAQEARTLVSALDRTQVESTVLERRAGVLAQHGLHAEAVDDFRELIRREPQRADYARQYAASLLALNDWPQAATAVEAYRQLATSPEDAQWAVDQLAIALRAMGNVDASLAVLESEPRPETLRLRADMALQAGNHVEAVRLYTDVAAAHPDDADVTQRLAVALRATGQLEKAYRLLVAHPQPENLRARAELALQLEHFAEAAPLYTELAAQYPDDTLVAENRAYAVDRASGDAQAEAEYRRLLDAGQASEQTRIRYGWLLLRAQRYTEAWTVVEPITATDEQTVQLKADAAFLSGRMAQSIALLQQYLELQPADVQRWRYLAEAQDAAGDPRSAVAALERAVAIAPDDTTLLLKAASLYQRIGKGNEALKLYAQVLSRQPRQREALLGIAQIEESRGNHGAALRLVRSVVETQSRPDSGLLLRLARLSHWTGNVPEAVRWYERVIGETSSAARMRQARQEAGRMLVDAGEFRQARAFLTPLDPGASADADIVLLAARAAMLESKADDAVRLLERLRTLRPLTLQEQEWLAGQYRAAGQPERAIALLANLVDTQGRASVQDAEALGDLLLDTKRPQEALQAYRRMSQEGLTPAQQLKIARAASQSGDSAAAMEAYTAAIAAQPQNRDMALEAARFMISAAAYDQALDVYRRAIRPGEESGLRLELALAHLAAQRFPEAETWASAALEHGEGGWRAVLALVQAMHLQGKTMQAERLLRDHEQEILRHREGKEWIGYVAVARDQHLRAFTLFDELIRDGQGDLGNLWLWRGIAATRRGDYARAQESLARAAHYGRTKPAMPVLPPAKE